MRSHKFYQCRGCRRVVNRFAVHYKYTHNPPCKSKQRRLAVFLRLLRISREFGVLWHLFRQNTGGIVMHELTDGAELLSVARRQGERFILERRLRVMIGANTGVVNPEFDRGL